MNAAFGRKMPRPGNLAFLSQSGAFAPRCSDYAEERQMGFSKFISFGNKADVNEIDLLDYLAKDEKTSVIAMYLEDVTNGRRFIETVGEIFWETHKPMLCLKSGRSPEGAKAVSSHTGSLAGSDSVYDALLAQSGVQRVDTIAELFDYAALYTTQPLPRGGRVAIVTNAGGPGIMATDAAVRHGLKLAELSEATKEKLKQSLPATASLRNPIDVIGDARADRYKAARAHRAGGRQRRHGHRDPHAAVDDRHRGDGRHRARGHRGDRQAGGLLVHGRQGRGGRACAILRKAGVPNYPFPEDGVKSLAAAHWLVSAHEIPRREMPAFNDLDVEGAKRIVAELLDGHPQRYLTQAECRPLLDCYRLPLLQSEVATIADEAAQIADSIGGPVVMKVMSADVVHKYDAGGVILNVHGGEEARAAYQKIHRQRGQGRARAPRSKASSSKQMARKGVEVILGASRDPRFGPLMMFGLGGTLVEVLKDVSFRLAPMWQISAETDGARRSAPSRCSTASAAIRPPTSTRSSTRCCGSRRWSATIRRFPSWTSTR